MGPWGGAVIKEKHVNTDTIRNNVQHARQEVRDGELPSRVLLLCDAIEALLGHADAYHLAAAATGVWSKYTAGDVGPSLSCREAEGLALALNALGHTDLAVTLLSGHANGDENPAEVDTDDEHYHLAGEGIVSESPEILRYLAAITPEVTPDQDDEDVNPLAAFTSSLRDAFGTQNGGDSDIEVEALYAAARAASQALGVDFDAVQREVHATFADLA